MKKYNNKRIINYSKFKDIFNLYMKISLKVYEMIISIRFEKKILKFIFYDNINYLKIIILINKEDPSFSLNHLLTIFYFLQIINNNYY